MQKKASQLFVPLSYNLQAAPLTRREITDSLNDETFGSTEYTSEDRAEEERKRRGTCSYIWGCLVEEVIASFLLFCYFSYLSRLGQYVFAVSYMQV